MENPIKRFLKTKYRAVKSNKKQYLVIEKKGWMDIGWQYVTIADNVEEAKQLIENDKKKEVKTIEYEEK